MDNCVTVIMPVYNTRIELLSRSINSVLAQRYVLELIIVDDGSNEETGGALDAFPADHPGLIRVMHKQNGGVSSARNLALSFANGDYVAFMDADDELADGYLESAVGI